MSVTGSVEESEARGIISRPIHNRAIIVAQCKDYKLGMQTALIYSFEFHNRLRLNLDYIFITFINIVTKCIFNPCYSKAASFTSSYNLDELVN